MVKLIFPNSETIEIKEELLRRIPYFASMLDFNGSDTLKITTISFESFNKEDYFKDDIQLFDFLGLDNQRDILQQLSRTLRIKGEPLIFEHDTYEDMIESEHDYLIQRWDCWGATYFYDEYLNIYKTNSVKALLGQFEEVDVPGRICGTHCINTEYSSVAFIDITREELAKQCNANDIRKFEIIKRAERGKNAHFMSNGSWCIIETPDIDLDKFNSHKEFSYYSIKN